jgi:glucan phosphoethanolaminetransferase (alkaline phosphatase superfamily)
MNAPGPPAGSSGTMASNSRITAAFAMLCLPYLALAAWLAATGKLASVAAFAASVLAIGGFLAAIARTWRRFFWLNAPLWLLALVFAGYTLTYGDVPGELLAYVLATSTWDEVRGFFGIWQGERLVVESAALGAIYLILAARSPRTPMFPHGIPTRRFGLPAAMVVLCAVAALSPAALPGGLTANPLIGSILFASGPLHSAASLVQGTSIPKVHYGTERILTREVHILVIGESARRDSWSVYGYSRPTTPNLDKLRGEAIFFQNAVADANVTICAVPILLTGISPSRFDLKAVQGNLVGLAGEAGYFTAWLMNQDPHISLLTGIHADRMVYPPSLHALASGRLPLDQVLLPEVRDELEHGTRPQFIGLHVIGSHWAYDSRYPVRFKLFGSGAPLTYLDAVSGRPDQRVVDAYDNSVAYTDWFLGQIIDAARRLSVPVTITYFSDHGEDLYLLDGQSGHGAARYSKHQFDIPAFVWVNSAYREAHPNKVLAMEQNAGKEIRSHNVFYSVADLMGIQWPGARPAESFASAAFVPDIETPLIAGAGGTRVTPGE